MRRTFRSLAAAACTAICLALAVAPAMADTAPTTDDSQLLDVSKQVAGIQKQLDDLLAHGRLARLGPLAAVASCGYGLDSPVFLPWGDPAYYALAPQGDFGSVSGWTFNKRAGVVAAGDPFTGAGQSLELANGGQAASPAMCVNLENPTARFFTRDTGGNGKARLRVDLLYEGLDGHVKQLTVARVRAGSEWQPSVTVPIYMNMLAVASPDGVTAVAFRFTAEGLQKDETLSVSALEVDPFHSR
jgi:hypothetical protein